MGTEIGGNWPVVVIQQPHAPGLERWSAPRFPTRKQPLQHPNPRPLEEPLRRWEKGMFVDTYA